MFRNRAIGPRPAPGRQGSAGFTLIELLVALAIFAIVSAFAYRSLDTLLGSREALQKESRKWRDIALFVGRVERDLRAVLLDRTATSPTGATLPPVSASMEVSATQASGLSLTRAGSALHENVLAAPQRVAYRLRDGRIERLTWAVDASVRDEPAAAPLLGNVRSLDFRFLVRNEWHANWVPRANPPGGPPRSPAAGEEPAAVEMVLTLASGERIVRVIDLPKRS